MNNVDYDGYPVGNYRIRYNNDTGINDESFWEWWEVEDLKTKDVVTCNSKEMAYKVAQALMLFDGIPCKG
jgi:hypothetical protein